MNKSFVVYNKENLEKVGDIVTNHSISLDDAIDLLGAEHLEMVNFDDPDLRIDGKEYWSQDLDMTLEDEYYAFVVRKSDTWDDPKCIDAMNALCEMAGQKIRHLVHKGLDCSQTFQELRRCASEEWLADTPDVSDDQEDLIDWLRHGAEQADAVNLAYCLENILDIDLGI